MAVAVAVKAAVSVPPCVTVMAVGADVNETVTVGVCPLKYSIAPIVCFEFLMLKSLPNWSFVGA